MYELCLRLRVHIPHEGSYRAGHQGINLALSLLVFVDTVGDAEWRAICCDGDYRQKA